MLKTIATINDFTKEEIFNAIVNVEIRKKWDTLFSEFKIVEENKEERSEVLYMALKVKIISLNYIIKNNILMEFE